VLGVVFVSPLTELDLLNPVSLLREHDELLLVACGGFLGLVVSRKGFSTVDEASAFSFDARFHRGSIETFVPSSPSQVEGSVEGLPGPDLGLSGCVGKKIETPRPVTRCPVQVTFVLVPDSEEAIFQST
jgi:hypothetical protein